MKKRIKMPPRPTEVKRLTPEQAKEFSHLVDEPLKLLESNLKNVPPDSAHAVLVLVIGLNDDDTATVGGFFQGHNQPLQFVLEQACEKEPRLREALDQYLLGRLSRATEPSSPTIPQS